MLIDGWVNTDLFHDVGHLLDAAYQCVKALDPSAQIEKPTRKIRICYQLRMIDWENFDGDQMRKVLETLDLRICDLVHILDTPRSTINGWLRGRPPQAVAIAAIKLLLLAHHHGLMHEFRGQLAAVRTPKTIKGP